jgi:DNA end-binding protein Ku
MAARSIAELSLSFGLVSIPVKLYTATETKETISFNFIHRACGSRVKQQYICIKEDVVVERSDMIKGYEFAPDQYVLFEPDELKAVAEKGTQSVDIVAFVPADSIDPIYYDKAYYLAPAKRGERPYRLLMEGMNKSGRVALARWAWRGKSYTAQVRPSPSGAGLVLQQLLYADEVRSIEDLDIADVDLKKGELDLALMLIEQTAQDEYDPNQYQDEVKQRIEAAIEQKIQGHEIAVSEEPEKGGAPTNVIDLMEVLKASLNKGKSAAKTARPARSAKASADEPEVAPAKARKGVKRAEPAKNVKAPAARKTAGKK